MQDLKKAGLMNFQCSNHHQRVKMLMCYVNIRLKHGLSHEFCEISSYNVVRHGRTYIDRGYCIAFYIKQGINSKIVLKSDQDSVVECIGVEISGSNPKCLVILGFKCSSRDSVEDHINFLVMRAHQAVTE
ncbi:hypothetical protein GQX74_009474 [Glossina fuscipes]|nr:hypothetical protein GQX74_009474 [Glossina fuscipes]